MSEIRVRSEALDDTLTRTSLPKGLGNILDIGPINGLPQSVWMLLAENGNIFRFNADTDDCVQVARSSVPAEPDHKPWANHDLRQRLHISNRGEFVAVVNDYGRFGQVIDVRNATVTLSLDGGEYHAQTVPLSFAFVEVDRRVIAIHRTEWNRLDFSDAATGRLFSERSPTAYRTGEKQPEHYLDYFHGALYVNPSSTLIVDDGWIWHPVGVPQSWSLERWFSANVWESEDGPSKKDVCVREYYWDHAIVWFDDSRVAIGGIGDDNTEMIDGARIFDVTMSGQASERWRSDWEWAQEVIAFAGPAGSFFSDGVSLFSACPEGLSRWSVEDGSLTGRLPDFRPTHHHRGAGELVQWSETALHRWTIR